MKKLKTLFTSSVLAVVVSLLSSTEGVTNMCTALRVFAVTNSTNATLLTFTDTLTNQISTTSFENESVPTSEVCGRGYIRCNLLLTSSSDGTIIVAVFPLQSGIALVSYDAINGTLVFREKFILTQMLQDCTFMYFIETRGIQSYCLGPPAIDISLYTLEIRIIYGDLSSSRVQGSQFGDFTVLELDTLSNFILYPGTVCFLSDDGNHVVFLESGDFIDQSFADMDFNYPIITSGCSGVSQLQRVGDSCQIVTECDGQVTIFDINNGEFQLVQPKFTSGQFFVCTEQLFVEFINGTLTLFSRTGSERQFVNDTSFPFEHIARGACTVVKEQLVLVITLNDGRTFLVDFVQSSYHQLGESNPAMVVSSEVNGQVVAVNNGSETLIYDLPCCSLQPAAVLQENFVLVNYMSMSRTDARRQCSISPSPSATVIPPTPSTEPSFSDNNNNSSDKSLPGVPVSNYSVAVSASQTITPGPASTSSVPVSSSNGVPGDASPSLVPSTSSSTPQPSSSFDVFKTASIPTRPVVIIDESLPPSSFPSPTASPRNERSSLSSAEVAVSVVIPSVSITAIVVIGFMILILCLRRRRRHKKAESDICISGSSTPVKSKLEEIPLNAQNDNINQMPQVVNDLESTLSISSQAESPVNSSEHLKKVVAHQENFLNNSPGADALPGKVDSLTKRRQNLANNSKHFTCSTPVNVMDDSSSVSGSVEFKPEQERESTAHVFNTFVSQYESESFSNPSAPGFVNVHQESSFSINHSNLVAGSVQSNQHRRGSAPTINERPLSSVSTFSNLSAGDHEDPYPATYPNSRETLAPLPASETSMSNDGASVMYHHPSSFASLQPHGETVEGALRNREQRENQASFKDNVSKVRGEVTQGGAAEPDNSVQRQYSTNSENDG